MLEHNHNFSEYHDAQSFEIGQYSRLSRVSILSQVQFVWCSCSSTFIAKTFSYAPSTLVCLDIWGYNLRSFQSC